jgi:hypothetical protein
MKSASLPRTGLAERPQRRLKAAFARRPNRLSVDDFLAKRHQDTGGE